MWAVHHPGGEPAAVCGGGGGGKEMAGPGLDLEYQPTKVTGPWETRLMVPKTLLWVGSQLLCPEGILSP